MLISNISTEEVTLISWMRVYLGLLNPPLAGAAFPLAAPNFAFFPLLLFPSSDLRLPAGLGTVCGSGKGGLVESNRHRQSQYNKLPTA